MPISKDCRQKSGIGKESSQDPGTIMGIWSSTFHRAHIRAMTHPVGQKIVKFERTSEESTCTGVMMSAYALYIIFELPETAYYS